MEIKVALQPGTKLQNGQYTIEKVLGQGATGITYMASMVQEVGGNLGAFNATVQVAIKEFFLENECMRDTASNDVIVPSPSYAGKVERFKDAFVREAHRLSNLKHDNIVHVLSIFHENNTHYYVMQYIRGGSLQDILSDFGYISENIALKYGIQVSSALCYMHNEKMMCHYDLKPGNIMLSSDNRAMLIDFGISKNYDNSGHETSTTPPGLSKGFAPLEQYSSITEFSPKIDVYSLGATLFYALSGKVPEEPTTSLNKPFPDRPQEVSLDMWNIVRVAMTITAAERPTMQQIHDRLVALAEERGLDFSREQKKDPDPEPNPNTTPGKTVYEDDPKPDPENPVTPEKPVTPEEPEKPEKPEKPNKHVDDDPLGVNAGGKSKNNLLYILVCVVAFAIVGVGAYFITSKMVNKTETQNATADTTEVQAAESAPAEVPEVPIIDENGQQTMTFKGNVVDGKPSGKGILTYIVDDQKDHYEGNFVNGKCEDKAGAMFYRNGDVYRGGFIGGHMTTGTYYVKNNGEYFEGQFQNDKPWKGYWFDLHNNVVAQVENGVEQ